MGNNDILLQYLLKYAKIMNENSLLQIIMASKREQVLKKHPYKITPPASDNTHWQTYYKDASGKRKIIRARSEQEIL